MKNAIAWAIRQTPAMNTFMVSILVAGIFAGAALHREEFPRFELEIVLVAVAYPGASPEEVESGICQKIEEAVRSVDGIKKVTSVAAEGSGNVVIEIKSDVPNVDKVLNEIKSEVDRIPSFPDLIEEPEIRQVTFRNAAASIGIVCDANAGEEAELQLREITERVREDLLLIPEISVAEISGERDYQIDIEIPEKTLRSYGLTLPDVARRIRTRNLELPGGNIRDQGEVYLIRGKDKRLRGEDIAKIPLITKRNGVVLTVGDLGTVHDEFVDQVSISRINGQPGLAIEVQAAAREDILAMVDGVRNYIAETELPPGFRFEIWNDASVNVNDRLELLKKNGAQGLCLVFLVLAMFLELRLAFWVALGIPVSVLGACAVLWQFDQTLNMLSMFAFLIALGIVVDDAIVIGENIYAHRELGKPFLQAAIDGTVEVVPSVSTSIATTVFAFMPMFFVVGVMGKFFAVIPVAVIAMLIISLVESTFILPCHLAHKPREGTMWSRTWAWYKRRRSVASKFVFGPIALVIISVVSVFTYPLAFVFRVAQIVNGATTRLLSLFIENVYVPGLQFGLRNPASVIAAAIAALLLAVGLVKDGKVPWVVFPKLDAPIVEAKVAYPDGTPSRVTDATTQKMEESLRRVEAVYREKYGKSLIRVVHRKVGQMAGDGGPMSGGASGSHVGQLTVELIPGAEREWTSDEILAKWREENGEAPGVESMTFATRSNGPGGQPIEFKLLAPAESVENLETAVERCKVKLADFDGVLDIADDSRPGKWELQFRVKDDAKSLGVPLENIAQTVRSAYYGNEVMRIQRGRHEVKIMVRYPPEERRSLARLDEIRVDTGDGIQRPIGSVARIDVSRGYSEINRIDQQRSITITADVDEKRANAASIVRDLQTDFVPGLLEQYPNVSVRWEGQQEQSRESVTSLGVGTGIAMLATFVLLTLQFSSYLQPAIVMAVIPFGTIGAIWGHYVMGLPFTLFSVLGLVALTGVVVNDSIVLVDFINARLKAGAPLKEAVLEAGQRRFRPVLLTSLTTVAGLLPILTETSYQAQLVIPMATSLCFGLLLSTVLVLFLVPTFYLIYGNIAGIKNEPEDDFAQDRTTPALQQDPRPDLNTITAGQ